MGDPFDPYYQWLGIPPQEQPPNYYRLLGLSPFEANPQVIEGAAARSIQHLQSQATGPQAGAARTLLAEVDVARRCLLDAEQKAAYDLRLRSAAKPAMAKVARARPVAQARPVGQQRPTGVAPIAGLAPVRPAEPIDDVATTPVVPLVTDEHDFLGATTSSPASSRARRRTRNQAQAPPWMVIGALTVGVVVLILVGVFLLTRGDDEPVAERRTSNSRDAVKRDPAADPVPVEADEKTADDLSPGTGRLAAAGLGTSAATPGDPAQQEKLVALVARGANPESLPSLISAGAKVDAIDAERKTPLRIAAVAGHTLWLKALLEAKANPNLADEQGVTPLMSAVQRGDEEQVTLLLAAGADPNARTVDGSSVGSGLTPLLIAARQGNLEIAKALLAGGAKIDAANGDGVTPLMVAAWQGNVLMADLLLTRGADVHLADSTGQTPLMYAAHGGQLSIVRDILKKGAEPNAKSKDGTTALAIALGQKQEAVITALREAERNRAPALDF